MTEQQAEIVEQKTAAINRSMKDLRLKFDSFAKETVDGFSRLERNLARQERFLSRFACLKNQP